MKGNSINDITDNNISLKNFIKLGLEEKKEILNWRNSDAVRTKMLTTNIITLDEHLDFIDRLATISDKIYFLASFRDENIGVLDYYNIKTNEGWWGFYLKPDLLGKSYGVLLEYVAIDVAFERLGLELLFCETLTENIPVLKMHKQFGFQIAEEKENVIIMKISKNIWESNKTKMQSLIKIITG